MAFLEFKTFLPHILSFFYVKSAYKVTFESSKKFTYYSPALEALFDPTLLSLIFLFISFFFFSTSRGLWMEMIMIVMFQCFLVIVLSCPDHPGHCHHHHHHPGHRHHHHHHPGLHHHPNDEHLSESAHLPSLPGGSACPALWRRVCPGLQPSTSSKKRLKKYLTNFKKRRKSLQPATSSFFFKIKKRFATIHLVVTRMTIMIMIIVSSSERSWSERE